MTGSHSITKALAQSYDMLLIIKESIIVSFRIIHRPGGWNMKIEGKDYIAKQAGNHRISLGIHAKIVSSGENASEGPIKTREVNSETRI